MDYMLRREAHNYKRDGGASHNRQEGSLPLPPLIGCQRRRSSLRSINPGLWHPFCWHLVSLAASGPGVPHTAPSQGGQEAVKERGWKEGERDQGIKGTAICTLGGVLEW
jgi:hypothetical protein